MPPPSNPWKPSAPSFASRQQPPQKSSTRPPPSAPASRRPAPSSGPAPSAPTPIPAQPLSAIWDTALSLGFSEPATRKASSQPSVVPGSSSLKLVELMRQLLESQDALDKIETEVYDHQERLNTADFCEKEELDAKSVLLEATAEHLSSVLDDLLPLVNRLKRPYAAADHLAVEPEHHRALADLLASFQPRIAESSADMQRAHWVGRFHIEGADMTSQLSVLPRLIAIHARYAEGIMDLRHAMQDLRDAAVAAR
ncbi:hypothetical protein BDK51DRAFT_29567 [Blyttiomyces helicus]|uniref:HAUS augmin-like complex subunit 2-domain-containing protein n=1 Tax=Blyttiomyces helicus TaxID=388810 RepID=A0A4P9VYD0_9FUNG|nr:hypothetical protein BDK51DRAFT_29567 [Blyttiomyces helicus]|eukprot:RKO84779.1 hypothetical protein BDK51DRAFT_29567 [Blyttiomyces helicus]